jgi:hypothetical protein
VTLHPVRSQRLHQALRAFCLGSFFALSEELEAGANFASSLDEHGSPGGPTLYEYRPLVGAFIEERSAWLGRREDTLLALAALREEPSAGIFACAHSSEGVGEDEALRRMILMPLLVRTAERCGGFDWDDPSFEVAYAELERRLRGDGRLFQALVPLVGLTAGAAIELGSSLRVRRAQPGEPDEGARGAKLPPDFAREWDRLLLLELTVELDPRAPGVPETATLLGHAISALRLATPGAIAAGPTLFERLDGRLYDTRPMPALACQIPAGEPTRLDPFRATVVAALIRRLSSLHDHDLLEALERFEIALFNRGPLRADELSEALILLLGGEDGGYAAALRASALLGESPADRGELLETLRGLVDGDGPGGRAEDVVRRALIESVLCDSREQLVRSLDEALLGARPYPGSTSSRAPAAR